MGNVDSRLGVLNVGKMKNVDSRIRQRRNGNGVSKTKETRRKIDEYLIKCR